MKLAQTSTLRKNVALVVLLLGISLSLLALLLYARTSAPNRIAASTSSSASPKEPAEIAREAYGKIEMSFEANRGQTDSAVNFLARGAGYTLFLKPTEAVFRLQSADSGVRNDNQQSAIEESALSTQHSALSTQHPALSTQHSKTLRMRLVGADEGATAEGANESPGKVNYFTGSDPSQWRTEVPTYGRVRYSRVYPGVDLVYYGNQAQLEYDFVVAPGQNAQAIQLKFDGADKLALNERGDLLLTLAETVVRQPKPIVYQEVAGERRAIEGGYALGNDGRVGFNIGDYDARLPLIIDPTLVYSTYIGGSSGENGLAFALDSAGNAYITGFTNSTNFPTANAFQSTNGGFQDAFVTKINAAGTAFVYSTYLGGDGGDQARGIAVDSAGNAYVTGFTGSTNFPVVNAIKSTSTDQDAFVTKINATGSALVYSTYLGSTADFNSAEFGEGIAVDSAGNAYVTGNTFSDVFPTVNPIQSTFGGFTDAYVAKINAAGSAFVYSTYLGGSESEIGHGIAVDSAGNAYVTGNTQSSNFPTANALQSAYGGAQDAFVTKVNAAGTAFVYSTYLGGTARDDGQDIAVDASGNAYATGDTESTNFPTANAVQPTNGGTTLLQDAYVTKINAAGSALVYSTYLGGAGGEVGFGIAVDSSGSAYVVGGTGSTNTFPTANAIQCVRNGGTDVFVTKYNAAGSALIYSTYLGGSDQEQGRGIGVDSAGNAYIGGFTRSSDYPVVNPIQSTFGGDTIFGDAFVTKISDTATGPASLLQFTTTGITLQEDLSSTTVTVQRTGDTSGAVTVDYSTANGTASERSDYTTAVGTLRFAAGETTKTIDILINEDSFVEGTETFTVTLTNPTGGATLSCGTAVVSINITDDASEPTTNAIDDPATFVGQHYHDFLNRQADAGGLAFWTGQITACGSDVGCIDRARTNVSTAFFLSIEFQQTGYLVFRIYKETFTDSAGRPRGMPRYREFLRDTQEIGRGVVVGVGAWETQLEANKQAFARAWVQKPEFVAQFPVDMTAAQYVDKLFLNSEVTPTAAERNAAITAYGIGDTDGRAAALRSVADSGSVYNRQFNAGFVLSQYIGYLRRNPNDAPEPALDYTGFDYWLAKMNSFSVAGEDVRTASVALARVKRAEMVRAFIRSTEYRGRFGQP
jgi:hypothetical protein